MPKRVTCMGECLIDFFPIMEGATSLGYATDFRMHAGGSIMNVAVALSRLEQPSSFACKVADDYFGRYLRAYMRHEGVDTSFLFAAPNTHSTLAFVAMEGGHPAYSFYSEGSADTLLTASEIPEALYDETSILHMGSISLLNGSTPEAILATARWLKGRALLSFDPNIRPNLVQDEAAYRDMLAHFFSLADIVKCSDADLSWLYPNHSSEECLTRLLALGPALVVVTQGEQGAIAASASGARGRVSAVKVEVVDTVGAGDAFCAGLLTYLCEPELRARSEIEQLSDEALEEMLRFAAAVSALNCTRAGANAPRRAEVDAFLRQQ